MSTQRGIMMLNNCTNSNCWDSTKENPNGKPPITWCDNCKYLARIGKNQAVILMNIIERHKETASKSQILYAEMMRWIVRYYSYREEELSEKIEQLTRENEYLYTQLEGSNE